MNNLAIIVTTIYLSLSLSSCNKIEFPLELPAETQIGANTFGCKVNGETWRIRTVKEISHGNGELHEQVERYVGRWTMRINIINLHSPTI